MAPPPPRSLAVPRDPPRLIPPRSCSIDSGASHDATYNPSTDRDSLQSRLEAVDRTAARRKFALYRRQHAHVDHLSGTDQDTTIILQSTMLLQEDGLLAARLDDVMYLLDGLLEPTKTQRGRLAQARSVLELTQLFQDPKILQVVELSSQRHRIQARMKQLLLSKLGHCEEAGEETYRVLLAVLVYILSGSSDGQEYFGQKVLDAVVCALKQEVTREEAKEVKMGLEDVDEMKANVSVSGATSQPTVLLKKKCLKRKQSSGKQFLKPMDPVERNEGGKAGAFALEDSVSDAGLSLTTSTAQILDESCRMQLNELLHDHESFYVEGELQISVVGALCAALRNLLQVGGSSSNSSSDMAQRYQQQRSAQSDDAAGDTFQLIRARKRQVVRNGGIDVLVYGLANRLDNLEALLPSTQVEAVTLECAHLLHHVSMLLCVFDQVTFLTLDVQQYISKKRTLFALLLKLIQLLSELSWGIDAQKRWETESARMSLAMEVLLSALRVLINLTHHNIEAAGHVLALGGMQLFATSFSHLWGVVATAENHMPQALAQEKLEFDACLLLLSVMVNSIEFSEENRDALARTSLCQVESTRDGAVMPPHARVSACDLFTQFFLAKLQSYKHLFELAEAQGASGAISIEEEGDDWNPEDVILGGCTSLLLGYLMKGSTANHAAILELLPDSSPRLLLRALGVFVAFHSQIGALTPEVAKSVLQVEEMLKSCQGSEHGADSSGLLTNIAAKASPGVFEGQYTIRMDSISAVKSEEAAIGLSSAMAVENSAEVESSDVLPPSLRARSLKNVCYNLDDSDGDNEPHSQVQDTVVGMKVSRVRSKNHQAFGTGTPSRIPPRSPCRKRPRMKSPVKTPSISQISGKRSLRASRSSLTAVLPDGSLSSPVVARLLKRTRQLVEEFDAEFAKSSHSTPEKKIGNSNESGTPATDNSPSPCMVLTMDVTCRDNGNDGLDLSQDVGAENCNAVDISTIALEHDISAGSSSKRTKKPMRNEDTTLKSAVVYQGTSFDLIHPVKPPSTPLRTQGSPGLYRQSPSLNLTPTKTTPSTPLRFKKSAGLLRTPTKNDRPPTINKSPLLASPHRRKAKVAHAPPSTRTSSIFDFTD